MPSQIDTKVQETYLSAQEVAFGNPGFNLSWLVSVV